MAEEKKNPLIGAFRSPPPKEAAKVPPDAKAAEPAKPPEADKPILAAQKPTEPVKPVIPPKEEETKAAPKPNSTATPVKPTVEKPAVKPPVPAKAEDAKAAVKPAVPAKPEEAKPAAKPEEKKAEKPAPAAAADTRPAKVEEKKPVAAPAEKKSEEKKPEEKPPAKQEEKKADVPAKSEDKKPAEDKPASKAEVAEEKEQLPEKEQETDAEGIPKDFKLNIVGEGALGSVVMLPVDKIDDFEGHPFPVQDDKEKPFVTLLLLFGKNSGFAVLVRDSYIRTKDSRRTTMKLTDFYAYTEQTFDSFCKQVIRNERTDALRELAYHAKNETAFSALTPVEMARLSIVDRIPEDTVEFHIRGYTVAVENAALGQAIAVLPVRLRDVALLYYFAGMSDPQIGQLLRLKPDTVQHRRAASLTKLRKLLGGSYGQ